jgi:CubicO group peptidase (beta-lactamase class C family)
MDTNFKLPRSTPELEGIPSAAVASFLEAIEESKLELHSFMLLRHGKVTAEGWWSPYGADLRHSLFSLSKSFTSTAVGFAVSEGLLTVDDSVISFFPEELSETPSENLAAMKIKHLLSMSTGHDKDTIDALVTSTDGNWIKAFLSLPVEHEPGTHFAYNTGASYMLSAIVQVVSGKMLFDYLTPRLFEPLNIADAAWGVCPRGINFGGFGLSVRTEDIAKFGQLYLQKGLWAGKQIIPKKWIEEATSKHISNGDLAESDWAQGYGYQFWRCRHNAYRGDGAFGQYCVVMPEKEAVFAATSAVNDMQAVLNKVWDILLPAMEDAPLSSNAADSEALHKKLSSLSCVPDAAAVQNPHLEGLINNKTYVIEENQVKVSSIAFEFNNDEIIFKTVQDNNALKLSCGRSRQLEGSLPLFPESSRVMASATWIDEATLLMNCRFIETPFAYTVKYVFDEDNLDISLSANVNMGEMLSSLKGHLEK